MRRTAVGPEVRPPGGSPASTAGSPGCRPPAPPARRRCASRDRSRDKDRIGAVAHRTDQPVGGLEQIAAAGGGLVGAGKPRVREGAGGDRHRTPGHVRVVELLHALQCPVAVGARGGHASQRRERFAPLQFAGRGAVQIGDQRVRCVDGVCLQVDYARCRLSARGPRGTPRILRARTIAIARNLRFSMSRSIPLRRPGLIARKAE